MLLPLARSILPLLPATAGFAFARTLADLSSRPPLKPRDREALRQSVRIEFGRHSRKLAWTWGRGPLVVLVHGWGARATKMVPLAQRVAAAGFQVVLFDVTAHGESRGWHASFRDFILDVAELTERMGVPVHAYVGHSAGGLCLMAARAIAGIHAGRYVCLCAPRGPYVPVEQIRRLLNPSPQVLRKCERYYAAQFGASWEALDRCSAYAPDDGRLLLVYDADDQQIEPADGDRIAAVWPGARLVKTSGLGHNKLLWDYGILDEVAGFVADGSVSIPGVDGVAAPRAGRS